MVSVRLLGLRDRCTMESYLKFPKPSTPALAHSQLLADLIRERIAAAEGWLDFAEFMQLALYAPGLGYYSAGARKFGPAGDFVTAPEISPVFGRCIARSLTVVPAPRWRSSGRFATKRTLAA